jgi:hypothetical protein
MRPALRDIGLQQDALGDEIVIVDRRHRIIAVIDV